MATTTPASPRRDRSTSRTRRHPPSRPTTPLRAPSRTSLRASASSQTPLGASHPAAAAVFPLETLEPAFAELSDSMADLEANMLHLQLLHESTARFNEDFAAFLYGLNMSAFCVDFPEAPGAESFRRAAAAAGQQQARYQGLGDGGFRMGLDGAGGGGGGAGTGHARGDVDATFLTTDTSFVDNPPASTRPAKFMTPARAASGSTRGSAPARGGVPRGRGVPVRGARGGLPASAAARGSGIGRGRARGSAT